MCWGTWGVGCTGAFLCEETETNQRQLDPYSGLSEAPTQTAERETLFSFSEVRLFSLPNSLGILLLLSQMQLKMLKPMVVYVGGVGREQIVQSSKMSRQADINGEAAFL